MVKAFTLFFMKPTFRTFKSSSPQRSASTELRLKSTIPTIKLTTRLLRSPFSLVIDLLTGKFYNGILQRDTHHEKTPITTTAMTTKNISLTLTICSCSCHWGSLHRNPNTTSQTSSNPSEDPWWVCNLRQHLQG